MYVIFIINFEGFDKLKYVLVWLEMVKFIIFLIGLNDKSVIIVFLNCLKIMENVIM